MLNEMSYMAREGIRGKSTCYEDIEGPAINTSLSDFHMDTSEEQWCYRLSQPPTYQGCRDNCTNGSVVESKQNTYSLIKKFIWKVQKTSLDECTMI